MIRVLSGYVEALEAELVERTRERDAARATPAKPLHAWEDRDGWRGKVRASPCAGYVEISLEDGHGCGVVHEIPAAQALRIAAALTQCASE
jgi:hypothetical protein